MLVLLYYVPQDGDYSIDHKQLNTRSQALAKASRARYMRASTRTLLVSGSRALARALILILVLVHARALEPPRFASSVHARQAMPGCIRTHEP